VSSYLAPTPELRDGMLRTWLRRDPAPLDRARLTLMGRITQLYAGCILLTIVVDPATPTHTDLAALSVDEFRAAVARGDLRPSTPATAHAYAKLVLSLFLEATSTPDFDDALHVAAAG
jgi:hypothetical protein